MASEYEVEFPTWISLNTQTRVSRDPLYRPTPAYHCAEIQWNLSTCSKFHFRAMKVSLEVS